MAQIQEIPQLAETEFSGHELFSFGLVLKEESIDNHIIYTDSSPPPNIQEVLSLKQAYLL